jgi:hypothetical protein
MIAKHCAVGSQRDDNERYELPRIFVSHSSKDLVRVRQVRNYLEESDASPISFHLLALQAPEEFWPIIDREIEARNFFPLLRQPIRFRQ